MPDHPARLKGLVQHFYVFEKGAPAVTPAQSAQRGKLMVRFGDYLEGRAAYAATVRDTEGSAHRGNGSDLHSAFPPFQIGGRGGSV